MVKPIAEQPSLSASDTEPVTAWSFVVASTNFPSWSKPGSRFKGRLSDTEIWSVVLYVKSLGMKK